MAISTTIKITFEMMIALKKKLSAYVNVLRTPVFDLPTSGK